MEPIYTIESFIPVRSTDGSLTKSPAKENQIFDQKIPKKIFQTWKSNILSKEMYEAIRTVIDLNPDYEYYFFNDMECRDFIKNNFESDILKAYDNILPGAYKADLWRYCILYMYGGVYLDCKTVLLQPLSEIIKPDIDGLFCLDRPKNYLLNAIMMIVPQDEYILNLIKTSTQNILDENYDKEDWQVMTRFGQHGAYAITGPYLCGKQFIKYANLDESIGITRTIYTLGNKIYDFNLFFNAFTPNHIYYQDKLVMYKNYPGYYQKSGRDSYSIMFHQKRIFKKDLERKPAIYPNRIFISPVGPHIPDRIKTHQNLSEILLKQKRLRSNK